MEVGALDFFAWKQAGISCALHLDAAQHLANDTFEVLVVDGYSRSTKDTLNLVDDVACGGLATRYLEHFLWIKRTITDRCADLSPLPFLKEGFLSRVKLVFPGSLAVR